MKTATQSNYRLYYSQSSTGFQFITVRSLTTGEYAEFSLNDAKEIVSGTANDIAFNDLPMSVCNLIRLWFGIS